jgi:multiple sugar transport system permease protein
MSVVSELRELKSSPKGGGDGKAAFWFLLPWFIGLFAITAGPLVASLFLSFTDYNLLQTPNFIGFENFIRMFSDERLLKSLGVTFLYVIVSVPLQLAFALALAIFLDKGVRGLSFYRSVFYLPSLIGGSVAIAVLWRVVFGTEGLVNQFLAFFGIDGKGWISSPDTAIWTLILLNVWAFGAPMVIFLAGLRQVPSSLYEAAQIDGAGKSSTWCCRSSMRSSRSRRPSSSPAERAARPTPRCCSRCTCTSAASATSTWGTPPPWPGCWC